MSVFLYNEAFEVGVAPELGGSLLCWRDKDGYEFVRDSALSPSDASETAGFPLIPFSNRIKDGLLVLSNRTIQLECLDRHSFALHGCGWLEAWEIEFLTDTQVFLTLNGSSKWPFSFEGKLRYRLGKTGLEITLSYTNLEPFVVPVGLGFHPYFANKSTAFLSQVCAEAYMVDEKGYPTKSHTLTRNLAGQLDELIGRPYLRGVTEATVISWPRDNRSVVIRSSPSVTDLILFDPKDNSFCVEPVSHAVNAMNLNWQAQQDLGVRHLPPNKTFTITLDLSVSKSVPLEPDTKQENLHA